jgi:hypothetical protein
MAFSHANCTHPLTPSGRRACRTSTGLAVKGPTVTIDDYTGIRTVRAPKATQKPVRIQPRRSGARVAATSSTCVQAALHTRGRCACGWEDWGVVA